MPTLTLQSPNGKQSYLFLTYIAAVYAFLFISPDLMLKKIVELPYLGEVPFDVFFTGTYFIILDVVTEVYGVKEAKKLLYAGLVAYTLFIAMMELTLHVPSATTHLSEIGLSEIIASDQAYAFLFSNIYLVWASVVVCALTANWGNIILLSKWKILVKGRYFWLRSMTTSFAAILIYSVLSNIFAVGVLLHPTHWICVCKVMMVSLLVKLITLALFAYPATFVCYYLKRKEGIDAYDHGVSYNPFRL